MFEFDPRWRLLVKRPGQFYWQEHSVHCFKWCAWLAGYLLIPVDAIAKIDEVP